MGDDVVVSLVLAVRVPEARSTHSTAIPNVNMAKG